MEFFWFEVALLIYQSFSGGLMMAGVSTMYVGVGVGFFFGMEND